LLDSLLQERYVKTMARVDPKPLYKGDDIARIDALSCLYAVFRDDTDPEVPKNPSPRLFPGWGDYSNAAADGHLRQA
jgi:hypothetical protein